MRKKNLAKKSRPCAANAFGLGFVTGTAGNTLVSTGSGVSWGNASSGNTMTFPNYTYPLPGTFQPIQGPYGISSGIPAPTRVCERCGTGAGNKTDPNEPPFVCGICKQGDRWDQRFKGMEAILEQILHGIERRDGRT